MAEPAGADGQPAEDEDQHPFEFEHEDIQYHNTIGEGTTATVFLGSLDGEMVAVKQINSAANISNPTLLAVQRELFVLSRVCHPNIMRFIGMVSSRLPVCLILEYCAGGSLFELLHNREDINVTWKQKLTMIHDTASALDYLHTFDPPILHRDLKSLNLMLLDEIKDEDSEATIKLADFGFARVLEDSSMTQCVGTKHWMAPEVLMGPEYTEKADIFSFAMVTYEVVCRHVPFEKLNPADATRAIASGQRPFGMPNDEWPVEAPAILKELVKECWAQDPVDRPESGGIVEKVKILLEPYRDTVGSRLQL